MCGCVCGGVGGCECVWVKNILVDQRTLPFSVSPFIAFLRNCNVHVASCMNDLHIILY